MAISQIWQLENIFKGGSASKEFSDFLSALSTSLNALKSTFDQQKSIKDAILQFQDLNEKLEETGSFVACLVAQDVHDKPARLLQAKIQEYHAVLSNISNVLAHRLAKLSDQEFELLLKDESLSKIAFPLKEKREREKEKLSLKEETLINDLSVDGYHAWSTLYGTVLGEEIISIKVNGKEEKLSWGQTYNRLSEPDRNLRKAAFESSNRVWVDHQSIYTRSLNHLAGFRLKIYEHRGWEVLKEPLDINRMSKATLDAMWQAIVESKPVFAEYLQCKAQLMGLKKLSWYDLDAPLSNQPDSLISYDDAADFIVDQFAQVSPKMAAYARKAFENGWIEAQDRGGKAPGGFCTAVPLKKESRIFMTYSGTNDSLFTLAHELGHAFHNEVIYTVPELARHFPMNLAETASTLAEMVISEAAYRKEKNEQRRLGLLNAKLQRTVIFFFNIHARFLFETRFYEERKKGSLSTERLCALMEQAQKEAYCNVLDEYHPYFWASKMHFHSTGVPFYNFPYTFGYLFSAGIYQKAISEKNFEDIYIPLLADTGRMTAEELAKKHLGVDLRQKDFWQKTIDTLKQDAHAFIKMAKTNSR